MKYSILSFFIVFCCISCGKKYREVTDFNLQPGALKDGAEIKIIAAVIGDYNKDDKYYNQLVAVTTDKNDTFNILIPDNPGLSKDPDIENYNYFSPQNDIFKYTSVDPDELQSLSGDKLQSLKPVFPVYERVIVGKGHSDIMKNKYPTVFGGIGHTSMTRQN